MGTQAPPAADTSLMHDVVDQVGLRIVGQNYMIERLLSASSLEATFYSKEFLGLQRRSP